jgi:hypothetical protein
MKCLAPINGKKRHCWVCSGEHWPKRCSGANRNCYTINQCCREIFDASYNLNEYMVLYNTALHAMLPKDSE